MSTLWLSGGNLLVNGSGEPILCVTCPCTGCSCSNITNSPDITLDPYFSPIPYTLDVVNGENDYFYITGTTVFVMATVTINGQSAASLATDGNIWWADFLDLGTTPGPGTYCCIITDGNSGQFCFEVIVP